MLERQEKINWIKFVLRNPLRLRFLLDVCCSQKVKIITKILRRKRTMIPMYAQKFVDQLLLETFCSYTKDDSVFLDDVRYCRSNDLQLATGLFAFENENIWEYNFSDSEDKEALHRFNWLLTKVVNCEDPKRAIAWGYAHVARWLKSYASTEQYDAQINAYTISEQIVNLLLFVRFSKSQLSDSVCSVLARRFTRLIRNLEYYGEQDTFNHFLNNARAIYFYGIFVNNKIACALARRIFECELKRLITSDGFLREGSSHYHFLFVKWLLEVFFLANEIKDVEMINLLALYLPRVVQRCFFFCVPVQRHTTFIVPRIGDISPDWAPEWTWSFFCLPAIRKQYGNVYPWLHDMNDAGWIHLWDGSDASLDTLFTTNAVERERLNFPESGWYRFECGDCVLILYVHPVPSWSAMGHQHNDLFSFVLYINGCEVLVDCGRKSYDSEQGVAGSFHNTFSVDGLSPIPFLHSPTLWKVYGEAVSLTQVTFFETDQCWEISIAANCFQRLYHDPVDIVRTLIVSKEQDLLCITDTINAKKEHTITSYFHFSPTFNTKNSDNEKHVVVMDNQMLTLKMQVSDADQTGFQFQEGSYGSQYGVTEKALCLMRKQKVQGGFTNRYQLSWVVSDDV